MIRKSQYSAVLLILSLLLTIAGFVILNRPEDPPAEKINIPSIELFGFQEGAVHRIVVSPSDPLQWTMFLCPSGVFSPEEAIECVHTVPRLGFGACLSRDGRFIAGARRNTFSVYDIAYDQIHSKVLSVTDPINSIITWHQDRQFGVGVKRDSECIVVEVVGQGIHEKVHRPEEPPAAVSQIANATLYQRSNFEYEVLREDQPPIILQDVYDVALAPDGDVLSYVESKPTGLLNRARRIILFDCNSEERRIVSAIPHLGGRMVWSPDSRYLFFHSNVNTQERRYFGTSNFPVLSCYDRQTDEVRSLGSYSYRMTALLFGARYPEAI